MHPLQDVEIKAKTSHQKKILKLSLSGSDISWGWEDFEVLIWIRESKTNLIQIFKYVFLNFEPFLVEILALKFNRSAKNMLQILKIKN